MKGPTTADQAVNYILDRIQTDPDVYYYLGPGTESFALLCAAEAARTGEPTDEVRKRRRKDLQPEYRRRQAKVVELEERIESGEAGGDEAKNRIEELEEEIACLREQIPDSRHCGHCGKCGECGFAYPCVCSEPTEPPRTVIQPSFLSGSTS